ncbi:hypothetical protein PF008_g5009 [Phytophthora fragariae]|uniref:Reverse transcriptase domain-containing protein n=1 Tax=Phytophthora fragariae TaxID=53985 RepID=A0A6G0S9K6_9STRA|nr:hypothetical protein PF008_g5009 [Phytophthora fragariae]
MCISTFDANRGYYARRLARKSRPYIAFRLPWVKSKYTRLPMDISTAPDEYQAYLVRIFGDMDFVAVYLNDILVFSENEEKHLEHLRIIFQRLEKFGVSLNGKKCRILRKEVDYLGHTLLDEIIRPQAKTIPAIQQIACPAIARSSDALGMINYYGEMAPKKTTLCKHKIRWPAPRCPSRGYRLVPRHFAMSSVHWISSPEFQRTFDVYADAGITQLCGFIM